MFSMNCIHLKKMNICKLKVGIFNTCDVTSIIDKTCPDAEPNKKPTNVPPLPPDARRTNYLLPPPPPPPHKIIAEDIVLPAIFNIFLKKKKRTSLTIEANGLDNQEGDGPFSRDYKKNANGSRQRPFIPINQHRSRGGKMLIAVAKDHSEAILDAVFTKSPELAKVYWHGKGIHPHTTVYYTDKDLEDHPTGVIPLLPKRVIALLHEVQYGV